MTQEEERCFLQKLQDGCYKTSALNRSKLLFGWVCVSNVISYTKPEQDWDICRFNSVFKLDRMPEVFHIGAPDKGTTTFIQQMSKYIYYLNGICVVKE